MKTIDFYPTESENCIVFDDDTGTFAFDIQISGKTYDHRDKLKELGYHWQASDKWWYKTVVWNIDETKADFVEKVRVEVKAIKEAFPNMVNFLDGLRTTEYYEDKRSEWRAGHGK